MPPITIDPAKYTLLVHGLVEQAIEFSLDDFKRLPTATRVPKFRIN